MHKVSVENSHHLGAYDGFLAARLEISRKPAKTAGY
jgi:hypothetical protein